MNMIDFANACLEHRTEIYTFLFSLFLISSLFLLGANND